MNSDALKDDFHGPLQAGRDALLWKLDGLSEYDVRRPLVPTGTNLLGLVKHLAVVEASYFGAVFDRPFPEPLPWWDDDAEPNSDMWATPGESRDDIIGLCQRACAHADATIAALPLDTVGTVPWWREGPGDTAPPARGRDRRDSPACGACRPRARAHRRGGPWATW